ncbi:hypothetical protein [Agaribacterium sp. ZY112]|uniref:hypothetical protein n=1 Tax=Agaribacterium sp. ZY112 TaxID=3233574 RepID=UPI003526657C
MVFIKIENSFADYELVNLRDFLELLDSKLASIEHEISVASCPDSEGVFDKAEYYVGLGFSAIQKYMTSIYTQSGLSKKNALNQGRRLCEGTTLVSIINATANYWKHEDEWGLRNIVTRDKSQLKDMPKNTVLTIEKVTPWADYTCSNVVAGLTEKGNIRLLPLIPVLTEWRNEICKNA